MVVEKPFVSCSLNSLYFQFWDDKTLTTFVLDIPYGGTATKMNDITVMGLDGQDYFGIDWPYWFYGDDDGQSSNGTLPIIKPAVGAVNAGVSAIYSLRWGTKVLRVDVVSLDGENPIRVAGLDTIGSASGLPETWIPRDRSTTGSFGNLQVAVWEGLLANGSYVPSGGYKLVLRVSKVFGDLNRGREYETFESKPFIMDMSEMP
jgi:hypothetical protein